jgi:hypothetical protein
MSVQIDKVPSRHHQVELVVEQDGLRVVVRKGAFIFKGEEVILDDDVEYVAVPSTHPIVVTGYMVRLIETGEVTIVVDEVAQNGVDGPARSCGVDILHCLFSTTVMPEARDLDVRVEHLTRIASRGAR